MPDANIFKNWKLLGIVGIAFVIYAAVIARERH